MNKTYHDKAMDESIKAYYKLVAIKSEEDHDKPLIDFLSERMIKVLFNKYQTDNYMKDENGRRVMNETVVGAGEDEENDMWAYLKKMFPNKVAEWNAS